MKLEGSYKLNVKKEVVWKELNNADVLKKCIPGCEVFEKKNDTCFNVTATNQIGPMNATFSGVVTLSNIKKNESYTLNGEGQSSVGFATGKANVRLIEQNGVTSLNYDVNINVGGKIAQLGSRLIDGVAKKMSDYFFGRFADIVSPLKENKKENESSQEIKEVRVKELKSNFLNVYIYLYLIVFILVVVAILYFVFR